MSTHDGQKSISHSSVASVNARCVGAQHQSHAARFALLPAGGVRGGGGGSDFITINTQPSTPPLTRLGAHMPKFLFVKGKEEEKWRESNISPFVPLAMSPVDLNEIRTELPSYI